MPRYLLLVIFLFYAVTSIAQRNWENIDSLFGLKNPGIHLYRSEDPIEGKPSVAYYVVANLHHRSLSFDTDTTLLRRITPSAYFEKNKQPLVVVNSTFFSLTTWQNLNAVIKNKRLVSYNVNRTAMRGADTGSYRYTTRAALGIRRNGEADVAWLYTDSSSKFAYAYQDAPVQWKGNGEGYTKKQFDLHSSEKSRKWKVRTAVAGGPALIHNGEIRITNNEEMMFSGKAQHDRHPRTAIGYTPDGKLIILVVEGRNAGVAEGASLVHLAEMLKELGCVEALNLDGGGSSCMLVNGKQTIKPSDKEGQRAVPAVFMIKAR